MNFRAVSITTRVRVSPLRVGYQNKLNHGGVQMIYEFRTYEATPGNLPALNKHLEVAAGLFKKHGLGVIRQLRHTDISHDIPDTVAFAGRWRWARRRG